MSPSPHPESPSGPVAFVHEADPARIRAAFESQYPTALRWRESTAAERSARIRRLRDAMLAQRSALYEAFARDYGKPAAEVDGSELLPVLDEMRHAIAGLRRWMRPRRVRPTLTTIGTVARIEYQPRGRVLVIAPWNYPLSLCFGPLVSALAAGNAVMVKPSEMTPAVSAAMARIVANAFPPSEVALFEGGPQTARGLLELPFDHIFFTGSPEVGRIVMAAAAKHLASVTLELGGKTPAIVARSADLRGAAETLLWGKFLNAGQTCVAPDHVYVHEAVKDAFVAECRAVLRSRYGATPAEQLRSPDLARIVNARHVERLAGLLQDALAHGAVVDCGGEIDREARAIAPTLLDRVPPDARVMEEEIFGPLLPVLGFSNLDAVIAAINARPKPLALYVWTRDSAEAANVLERTSSGGACINHCVIQFAHGRLPFGGVNHSGIGNAHGVHGFRAFSHERAVLRGSRPRLVRLFFPPYTATRQRIIRRIVDFLR